MDNNSINEIKKRINIVDLLSNYISLKKRGKSFIGLCPFHHEKTPSFNVNPDKGFYKCFGCGESGDIFTFIQKYENVEFYDALKLLAEKAGVQIEVNEKSIEKKTEKDLIYLANGYAIQFFKKSLNDSQEALSYLSRRGISNESINKFSLGFAPDRWDGLLKYLESYKISKDIAIKAGLIKVNDSNNYYDMFRNRVIYPIFNSFGKPIGFGGRNMGPEKPKYLNTSETPVFNKGHEFYGFNLAKDSISKLDQAIICEGYMDVIACHSNGITNAIAVLGTALTKDHIAKISRYTKNIVLCFDADSAGIHAAFKNGDLFLEEDIYTKVAVTPIGEDPDSFLLNNPVSKFQNIINNAIGILDFEINSTLNEFDLSNPEQRILALTEACKIIAKDTNTFRREELIKKIVQYHPNPQSSNAIDDIRKEVNKSISSYKPTETHKEPIKKSIDKYTKAERIILSGICNGVYDLNIVKDLMDCDFQGDFYLDLFHFIREYLYNNQVITYSEIENKMRDLNHIEEFYDLIGLDESQFNHNGLELVDLLKVKRNKNNIPRRKELENKLRDKTITQEEQIELLKIIRGK